MKAYVVTEEDRFQAYFPSLFLLLQAASGLAVLVLWFQLQSGWKSVFYVHLLYRVSRVLWIWLSKVVKSILIFNTVITVLHILIDNKRIDHWAAPNLFRDALTH